jgi:hypothetical protein
MSNWLVCPTCNLNHRVRPDAVCPRCRQSVAHVLPSVSGSPPPVAGGVPASGAPAPVPTPPPLPPRFQARSATPTAAPANVSHAPGLGFCQSCGANAPTARVEFHQNIGALVMRFHKSFKGEACPACARKHFWEMTLTTLVGGWWGVISFFLTPFLLLNNVIQYLGYRAGAAKRTAGPAAGLPAYAGPEGTRKGMAVASLVLGVVGFFTLGLAGVGALAGLGLGIAALFKASREPQTYGGRGYALAGVATNVMSLLPAVLLGFVMLAGSREASRPRTAGETAFRAANQKIFAFHDEVAFGNTAEAKAMAERYSRVMQTMASVAFTGGSKNGASLSQNRFLTYCEVRGDHICFLVHVPELRNYKGDVRDTLLRLAWMTAQQVTQEARKDRDLKLAVGLRGALSYGAVAVGMGEGQPQKTTAEILDEKPLYEFFADATPPAAPAPR